mmetsp:Transcript_96221/g.300232  ORF Transcript_96221/g.300232 Transcript_96221/m.300232 type:complete len:341 (-) Transcript_96221:51-1073(-)
MTGRLAKPSLKKSQHELRWTCLRCASLLLRAPERVGLAGEWSPRRRRFLSRAPGHVGLHLRPQRRCRPASCAGLAQGRHQGLQLTVQVPGHGEAREHQQRRGKGHQACSLRTQRRAQVPRVACGCELQAEQQLHGAVAEGQDNVARKEAVPPGRGCLHAKGCDATTDQAADGVADRKLNRRDNRLRHGGHHQRALQAAHSCGGPSLGLIHEGPSGFARRSARWKGPQGQASDLNARRGQKARGAGRGAAAQSRGHGGRQVLRCGLRSGPCASKEDGQGMVLVTPERCPADAAAPHGRKKVVAGEALLHATAAERHAAVEDGPHAALVCAGAHAPGARQPG